MVLVTTGWQSPRLVGQTACWTLRVGHCLLLALYVYYQVLKCSRRMFCLRCLSAAAMRALKRTTEPPAFARARVWVRSGTVWVRPPPCTPVSSHLAHLASVEMGGKVFGTLGTVWVRGEYSALLMLLALVPAFTGKPSHLVSTAGDHHRHPRHRHR